MLQVNDFALHFEITPLSEFWDPKQKHLFLGSCFADAIGHRLVYSGIHGTINPLGTIFNPLALLHHLKYAMEQKPLIEEHCFERDGCWFSLDWHSQFYAKSYEALQDLARTRHKEMLKEVEEASYITLTLGTAIYYEYKMTGQVVANCQKIPSQNFLRKRASVEEVSRTLDKIEKRLKKVNPDVEILYTVSPVRHKKEGLHENNLSKATLLLAVDESVRKEKAHYFPSYELALDVLRDYRFYEEDQVHLNEKATSIIFRYFRTFAYDPKAITIMEKVLAYRKDCEHRVQFPDSEAARKFKQKLEEKRIQLVNEWPHIEK